MKNLVCSLLISSLSFLPYSIKAQIITTIAGNGTQNITGNRGPAVAAELSGPSSLAIDANANLYFSDNNSIRQINTLTGIITSIVDTFVTGGSTGDDGLAAYARLLSPQGVALDHLGNLYIADENNERIRKVNVSTDTITTFAGNGTPGCTATPVNATSINAYLNNPARLAIDALGNAYIIAEHDFIQEVNLSTGMLNVIAGRGGCGYSGGYSGDGGMADTAAFNYPIDIALDAVGNIYIVDGGNYCIRKITVNTGVITTIAGNGTPGYSGDGGLATSAKLISPKYITVDNSDNIYFTDGNSIRKVNNSTGIITHIVGQDTTIGSLSVPIAGYSGDDGLATSARINLPSGLASDALGNLYIADAGNHRIRKIAFNTSGINDMQPDIKVSIYPMPSKGDIQVKLNGKDFSSMAIYDEFGREIYSQSIDNSPYDQNLHIDLRNIADGIYFLQVVNQAEALTKRLIIQK
jgi:hypothetical protein